jgi:hypothetical protein
MILFLKRVVAGLIITGVSLAVPAALFALVFFFPTLTCNGGGAGGNCGEGYMVSIPLAVLLIPLYIYAMVAVGGGLAKLIWPQASPPSLPSAN